MPTFLLTDVVGSPRLWEHNPISTSKALELHDRVLDEAVRAAGGAVVKERGEGDAVFAVFG